MSCGVKHTDTCTFKRVLLVLRTYTYMYIYMYMYMYIRVHIVKHMYTTHVSVHITTLIPLFVFVRVCKLDLACVCILYRDTFEHLAMEDITP